MRDFLLYVGFSILESSAMFYLIFKVFKIDIFPKEIIFSGAIMGFFSFVLRKDYGMPDLDIAVQLLLMILFIWLLFRIHLFYSTILAGMAYQAYLVIQSFYYFVMNEFGLFDSPVPYLLSISVFVMQSLSALTAFCVGWVVEKKRYGFDFIPHKQDGKLNLKPREKILFALNIPSFLLASSIIHLLEIFQRWNAIIPIAYSSILFGYAYLAYKRDRIEND